MKQTLLIALAFSGLTASAQFWTQKATTFTTASRGVDDISIVDDNIVWLKAYDGANTTNQLVKEYAKSTDGGNTWTSGTMGMGPGTSGLGISSIHAVSATTAYVSAYTSTSGVGGVWITTNGGSTWSKQTTAAYTAASFPNFVYFWDANNGITQGDPKDGYFEIYLTSNGGTTWTRVPSANIPAPLTATEYGYVHNYDVIGSTIWFGTSSGRLFKSTDMGMTWTVSQTPLTDFAGATISGNYTFTDTMNGLMNSNSGQLWNTIDGGATWQTLVPTTVFGNNDIEYIPGTGKVVSTGGATGYGSYYSLDNGYTWEPAEENTQFTVLEFLNSTTGFAGGFNTSPTVGGIFKYTGTQLPVQGFQQSSFKVYPNPSNGLVQVSGNGITSITVTDLLGKQVYKSQFSAVENADLNLTSLISGVYMMTVTNEAGATRTVKIVKN